MPGTSPSTTLYRLGKGILRIGDWTGTTPPVDPADYKDVGNCPKFDVEVTEETLEHFSSRGGVKEKDKTVTLQTGYTVTFDLDEVSIANLARFLRGTISGNVISAAQALDKEFALKFTSDNPAGENEVWKMWRCTLKPGGAFSLISDEWGITSFTGEGLSDKTNHATSPYFDVVWVTTTSA